MLLHISNPETLGDETGGPRLLETQNCQAAWAVRTKGVVYYVSVDKQEFFFHQKAREDFVQHIPREEAFERLVAALTLDDQGVAAILHEYFSDLLHAALFV